MAPTWADWEEMGRRMSSIFDKMRDLNKEEDLSGLSEAEREAKRAKAKEERRALMQEFKRISLERDALDFSGMSEAERAAEAERLRQQELEEARRLAMEGDLNNGWALEHKARVIDFDPKQGGMYLNRVYPIDYATFDHDEESPLGPMRFTDAVYGNSRAQVCEAVNILSVKIACSDVGFPIQVYGSVVARDSIDYKCVYLFRRDRDHCQVLNSKAEPLILTGPKRGLALLDDNYVEADLKIKDHEGQDRELSKGFLTIRGIAGRSLKKGCRVGRHSIATRLSTVDVVYAVVKRAVEATIAIEVVRGEFSGIVTAHTTSILKRLVLYDSKVAGADTGDGHRVIQLMRPVVSVYVKDRLMVDVKTGAGKSVRITFTPRRNGGKEFVVTLGDTTMRVKVAWSIMDP